MKMRIAITTAMAYKLRRIARVNQRTDEEQMLYYVDLCLDWEWELRAQEIADKLAKDSAAMEAFWVEHGRAPALRAMPPSSAEE